MGYRWFNFYVQSWGNRCHVIVDLTSSELLPYGISPRPSSHAMTEQILASIYSTLVQGHSQSGTSAHPKVMRLPRVAFAFSWLILPCLAKNKEINTERYIDGLEDADLRTILDLKPEPWRSVEEGHLGRLLIPRPCRSRY